MFEKLDAWPKVPTRLHHLDRARADTSVRLEVTGCGMKPDTGRNAPTRVHRPHRSPPSVRSNVPDPDEWPRRPGNARRAARLVRSVLGRVLGVVCLVAIVLSGAVPADAAESGQFGWPLRPRPTVERKFDKPERNWLPGHRGVDLAGVAGQSVLAAGEGIVVFAGDVAGKSVVSIDHPGGLRTTYEPVRAQVSVGSRVSRGAPIGTLVTGHEGCPSTACLHWGARRESGAHSRREYVDPLGLLHEVPVRLKPLEP